MYIYEVRYSNKENESDSLKFFKTYEKALNHIYDCVNGKNITIHKRDTTNIFENIKILIDINVVEDNSNLSILELKVED